MTYKEVKLDEKLLETLIALSAEWEAENSCHGYHKNGRDDIEPNRIWIAEEGGEVVGYLFAHETVTKERTSVMPEGTRRFDIEEIFVKAERRSQGVGGELFRVAEAAAKVEGFEFIDLSTATKNHHAILHFYIDELGMEFWSARLYKKL